ncbi:alpha/beta fold hydrolase [Mycolicibacterium austroafricanum]|uniref:alpha/beta fold hydrolase n=1 Tax=Mycolicibacterium austroafricanum TaxID=39687 RepID=UPI001CA358DA|nr:alpha/beta fold hydrolase [Mycolicibacterium austroafricanum]QZT64439.1 alpha/beta hydrolase [Mycolicibacterium austroafricanum]
MRRLVPAVVLSMAVVLPLAACSPGLAANPRFATDSGAGPQGSPQTSDQPPGPPGVEAPKNDLSWRDCTSRVFASAAVQPLGGVKLDCASYDADLDPINGATGTVSIGVVRATSVETPADAGPLVMTTGSDLPSSVQLPVWLSRAGSDVLKSHPIVSVDRRGIGMSGALDCRDLFDRQEMFEQAQFQSGDDPVANLGAITMTATTSCTDTIAPGDSAYDNSHAAEDIERLRTTWDVPTLALLGIGNGAQVALAYAGSHPNKVARLVLDSPLPLGISAEAATEQRVKGEQAALDAWAAQCVATNCPLGPDPKAAVDALLTAARQGNGPGGASVAAVADAISTALGYPRGGRVDAGTELALAIADARSGDTNGLNNLINQAETLRQTDGQFVNTCSDALNRPTPDRVRELVVAWGKMYPQFGTVGALDMVKCLNWPSGSAPKEPSELEIPTLLLGVANNPIVGNEGVAAVAATAINAGSSNRRVMWQGIGHGATIYSSCALPPVLEYLKSGELPSTDTYCPA